MNGIVDVISLTENRPVDVIMLAGKLRGAAGVYLLGAWDDETIYYRNTVVRHGGKYWLAKRQNVGVEPTPLNSDDWELWLDPGLVPLHAFQVGSTPVGSGNAAADTAAFRAAVAFFNAQPYGSLYIPSGDYMFDYDLHPLQDFIFTLDNMTIKTDGLATRIQQMSWGWPIFWFTGARPCVDGGFLWVDADLQDDVYPEDTSLVSGSIAYPDVDAGEQDHRFYLRNSLTLKKAPARASAIFTEEAHYCRFTGIHVENFVAGLQLANGYPEDIRIAHPWVDISVKNTHFGVVGGQYLNPFISVQSESIRRFGSPAAPHALYVTGKEFYPNGDPRDLSSLGGTYVVNSTDNNVSSELKMRNCEGFTAFVNTSRSKRGFECSSCYNGTVWVKALDMPAGLNISGDFDDDDTVPKATDVTGTANAIVLEFTPPLTDINAGFSIQFIPIFTNTDAVTVEIDDRDPVAVLVDANALTGGEIVDDNLTELTYDGTTWNLGNASRHGVKLNDNVADLTIHVNITGAENQDGVFGISITGDAEDIDFYGKIYIDPTADNINSAAVRFIASSRRIRFHQLQTRVTSGLSHYHYLLGNYTVEDVYIDNPVTFGNNRLLRTTAADPVSGSNGSVRTTIVYDPEFVAGDTINDFGTDTRISAGSLPLSGGTLTGAIQVPAGTISSPGLQLFDADTGFYSSGSNRIQTAINGVETKRETATGLALGANYNPDEALHIRRTGATAAKALIESEAGGGWNATRVTTGNAGPVNLFSKARGTIGALAAVAQNDVGMQLESQFYSGSGYVSAADIRALVTEATPGPAAMGTRLMFRVTPTGSVTNTEIMRLDHAAGLQMFGANTVIDQDRGHQKRVRTVAELALLTPTAGREFYCSNESGGPVPVYGDGTNWRRVTDRAIVS